MVGDRKMLDLDMAMRLWDAKSSRPRQLRTEEGRAAAKKAAAASTPEDVRREVDSMPDDQIPDLIISKERREHYNAELAKLEVDLKRGDLLPAADVRKEAFAQARQVREALRNLADRLSHQLAGETDPAVIHGLITDEHRQAIEALAGGE